MKDEEPAGGGLMWLSQSGAPSLRHTCEQGDGLARYGWLMHDGLNFGIQEIKDSGFTLRTEVVKRPGGQHGGDWSWRIVGTPDDVSSPARLVSILFYVATDGQGSLTPHMDGRDRLNLVTGTSEELGRFRIHLPKPEGGAGGQIRTSLLTAPRRTSSSSSQGQESHESSNIRFDPPNPSVFPVPARRDTRREAAGLPGSGGSGGPSKPSSCQAAQGRNSPGGVPLPQRPGADEAPGSNRSSRWEALGSGRGDDPSASPLVSERCFGRFGIGTSVYGESRHFRSHRSQQNVISGGVPRAVKQNAPAEKADRAVAIALASCTCGGGFNYSATGNGRKKRRGGGFYSQPITFSAFSPIPGRKRARKEEAQEEPEYSSDEGSEPRDSLSEEEGEIPVENQDRGRKYLFRSEETDELVQAVRSTMQVEDTAKPQSRQDLMFGGLVARNQTVFPFSLSLGLQETPVP
ncbi:unnamed protein product [Ranitomeya imitator]|uniref:Mannosyl-oligosaccharide glucosidase n=1 Tax=Ranitomeya imitator TaxID=111125 RepID=A0ABN9MHF5_9NEOB|nr:unnamed protein product [Ranitomeya imitator]